MFVVLSMLHNKWASNYAINISILELYSDVMIWTKIGTKDIKVSVCLSLLPNSPNMNSHWSHPRERSGLTSRSNIVVSLEGEVGERGRAGLLSVWRWFRTLCLGHFLSPLILSDFLSTTCFGLCFIFTTLGFD